MELIRSVATEQEGNSMFAGVGEWTREGTQLYREMLESGVMKDTVMVYGQMNKPSRVRLRVALPMGGTSATRPGRCCFS